MVIQDEPIRSISSVYALASEVFGDERKWQGWMLDECAALGGDTPAFLNMTARGRDRVYAELLRIKFGMWP